MNEDKRPDPRPINLEHGSDRLPAVRDENTELSEFTDRDIADTLKLLARFIPPNEEGYRARLLREAARRLMIAPTVSRSGVSEEALKAVGTALKSYSHEIVSEADIAYQIGDLKVSGEEFSTALGEVIGWCSKGGKQ